MCQITVSYLCSLPTTSSLSSEAETFSQSNTTQLQLSIVTIAMQSNAFSLYSPFRSATMNCAFVQAPLKMSSFVARAQLSRYSPWYISDLCFTDHPSKSFQRTNHNSAVTLQSSVRLTPSHVATIIAPSDDAFSSACKDLTGLIQTCGGSVLYWRALSSYVSEVYLQLLPSSASDLAKRMQSPSLFSTADVALQSSDLLRTRKKVAVFDLDSTLIQEETIDELAAELNIQPQVAAITARAMNGELDFRAALAERVSLLKGLPVSALDSVKKRVRYTPGAKELISVLRKHGVHTAVVSGGFDFLAYHVRDSLGLNEAHANKLEVGSDNRLTGYTIGDIVDAEFKRSTLLKLADKARTSPEGTMAIGDGSNDLLMIRSAGLGIAFNAKPVVQEQAKVRLNQPSLRNVLYLLGFNDNQIEIALA